MNQDRSWMNHKGVADRRKTKYLDGVDEFLEFAFHGAGPRPPRKTREGDEDHFAELQSQLTQRITELEPASTAKEELLRKEIEDLKVEQHEQLEKLKQEFEERQKSSEENFMRMIQSMVAGNFAAGGNFAAARNSVAARW